MAPKLPGASRLRKATRDRWAAFWASPPAKAVDLQADLPRLIRWAQATDEWDVAADTVRRARLVKGSMGQPVLNPLVAYMAQLEQTIRAAEDAFGMTPAARMRLKLDLPEGEETDPVDELNARRAARRQGAAG